MAHNVVARIMILVCFVTIHLFATVIYARQPLPTGYIEKTVAFKNLSILLRNELPKLIEGSNQALGEIKINALEKQIEEVLDWTGENGCLLEIEIEIHRLTGVTSLMGDPTIIGPGKSPENAYLIDTAYAYVKGRDRILPGARPGFRKSMEYSFFIWALKEKSTSGSGTRLVLRKITGFFTKRIKDYVHHRFDNMKDSDSLTMLYAVQADRIYHYIIKNLNSKVNDTENRDRIKNFYEARRNAQKKFSKLYRDFKIEKSKYFRLLQLSNDWSVLNVSQFEEVIEELKSLYLDKNNTKINRINSKDELTYFFESELKIVANNRDKLGSAIHSELQSIRNNTNRLNAVLVDAGAPLHVFGYNQHYYLWREF